MNPHGGLYWTPERIVIAVYAFFAREQRWPTSADFNAPWSDLPSVPTVTRRGWTLAEVRQRAGQAPEEAPCERCGI